jgi:hypothetical protein
MRLAQPSQLIRISHEIRADGWDNPFAVSKAFSQVLVVETYPLCSGAGFWHSATENVSAQQHSDQGWEISKQLRVSLAALRKWRVMKKGPQFLKVGSLVRYRQADIDQWLASLPVGGGLHDTSEDTGKLHHNGEHQAPVGASAGTVRLLPARARG